MCSSDLLLTPLDSISLPVGRAAYSEKTLDRLSKRMLETEDDLHYAIRHEFDAKAYYLIMQQYRKNQHNYAEEMKVSPAFYHTVYDALMKACFMEIAKLYDSSNGVVSIGTLLAKCEENQDLFPK